MRRLLLNAAGSADIAERSEITILDLLSALTNHVSTTLLASLEIDADQLRRAVERQQQNQRNKPSGTDDPVSTVKEDNDRGRLAEPPADRLAEI